MKISNKLNLEMKIIVSSGVRVFTIFTNKHKQATAELSSYIEISVDPKSLEIVKVEYFGNKMHLHKILEDLKTVPHTELKLYNSHTAESRVTSATQLIAEALKFETQASSVQNVS